ncbi:uncharacterized protein LOC114342556 [Diabrotica virgifera virgifera]|uniref:Uncharacterized protein LOC114342556 n=1 Tax=Diabrotica virgifera virgifera TaxID=50390 RepID=A0A6P7GZG4_DIAVI|nr:uncharacterized protein LOC114342556 [Diabrotica virgifera virgifera]
MQKVNSFYITKRNIFKIFTMEVVSVDEIKDIISSISNETQKHNINPFTEEALFKFDLYKNINTRTLHSQSTSLEYLKNLNDGITADVDRIKDTSRNNKSYVAKSQTNADDLNNRMNELQMKCTDVKKEINALEHKISHMEAKEKHFQKKRDEILVFKLLTNTHFSYDTKKVRGYVTGKTSDSSKTFDFNPQQMDNKKITDNLYNALKACCNTRSPGGKEDKENEKQ